MYHQPLIISAPSASQVCFDALAHFTADDPRNWQSVAPRGMTVRERLAVTYRLDNALACITWMARRRLSYPFMAAEFSWIMLGRDDVTSIARFCPRIADFSDDGVTFFGAYGPPFVRQLPYITDTLHRDPSSRQAVGVIWREAPASTRDVPCTVACQFLIRNGEVHGIFTMRSSDAWLGLPYDLFNFSRLTALIAGTLDLPPGSLTVNVGSAHLYDRDRARALEVVAARDFRQANAQPLNYTSASALAAISATLDGRPHPWAHGFDNAGWHELYEMLRYVDDHDAKRLVGDFQTVVDWSLTEKETLDLDGESDGRTA